MGTVIFIIKSRNENKSIKINSHRGASKAADAGSNNRSKHTKTMSKEYQIPAEDNQVVFYLAPEIGKKQDHLNLKSILFARRVLEKIINEYNIQPNQSIGFCTDIKTAETIMADLIEEYLKYWGDNIPSFEDDIDFDNPCQPILDFPGAL